MKKFLYILAFLSICCFESNSHPLTDNATTTMTFEDNLATPKVSQRYSKAVGRHISMIGGKFEEKGFGVRTVRNGEVLLISLPAEKLFMPNETELMDEASATLGYFKQAVTHPESYRLVIGVYADDTGDDEYSLQLTKERALSIRDFFKTLSDNIQQNIDYYWFGNNRYVVPNTSVSNRAANRRVEIYIIPEMHIIEASKAQH